MATVIIIGAGPVGLSAAIACIDNGHNVTIIDRNPATTDQSRAVAVSRNSLKLLQRCGATTQVLKTGESLRRLCVLDNDKPIARITIPGSSAPIPTAVALPQSETERILNTLLNERRGDVLWNTEATSLSQSEASVILTTQDRTTGLENKYEADYLLGADGSRSFTRNALDIEFKGEQLPETWSLFDVTCEWPWEGSSAAVSLMPDNKITFMVTLGNGHHRIIANHPRGLDHVRTLMDVDNVFWESEFKIDLRVAETLGRDRICLAGDAAHVHTPVGGQGMNFGIADAFAFADAVSNDDLESYRHERLATSQKLVSLTTKAYKFMTAQTALGNTGRMAFLRTAGFLTGIFFAGPKTPK